MATEQNTTPRRLLTPERIRAGIDRQLEAAKRGYETATDKDRPVYMLSALNFCAGRPLPGWLYHALVEMVTRQVPPAKEFARQFEERVAISELARKFEAEGKKQPKTKAEQAFADEIGLSVEGLRKRRSRDRAKIKRKDI